MAGGLAQGPDELAQVAGKLDQAAVWFARTPVALDRTAGGFAQATGGLDQPAVNVDQTPYRLDHVPAESLMWLADLHVRQVDWIGSLTT
jgi:hypothetical protein